MNVPLPDNFISHKRDWPDMVSLMVMEKDGRAMVHFYKYHDDPSTLFLSDLSVDPEHRKQGIGNLILNIAEDVARQTGADSISLWVEKDSWMSEWYQRKGYQFWSEKDGQENNVWLIKNLEKK